MSSRFLNATGAAAMATAGTSAQLAELDDLHQELESCAGDRDRFFAANERFHMRLLELTDNRWRNQLVADLRKVMKLNRHHSLFKQGRIEASLHDGEVVQADVVGTDPDTDLALLRPDFSVQGTILRGVPT